jgi:hypothetical protein
MLERAPSIHGWEFYGYRLPENVEQTKLTVEGRTGADISDYEVQAARGEHNCIDVCYYSPQINDENDETARHTAFVATETLLGEECLNKWIGAIEVKPVSKSGGLLSLFRRGSTARPIPLDRMKDTVEALINSIRDQLSPNPHFQTVDNATWTLWELNPDEEDDYFHQCDLFVARSPDAAMWTAAHSGVLFYSERFSRCSETFCYVKLDGAQQADVMAFADKAEIEDALDDVLKSKRLGCSIGGGTGRRYSYIDLALTDLDRGIAEIRDRLRRGRVPKRSWIQFYDTELAEEWVGIYDDSPKPPMPPPDE